MMIKVSAWNNGTLRPSGAGYGLRLSPEDRDACFLKSWKDVSLELPEDGGPETVKILLSNSFWNKCPELRSQRIGELLIKTGNAKWPKNDPPTFELHVVDGNHFTLHLT